MNKDTYFAPAPRSTPEEIIKEFENIYSQKIFNEIFGNMTGIGAVLDKNRQIVYANNDFLKMIGIDSVEEILGKRPGEAVSCIHAADEKAGCGTSEACEYCGAVKAILESQKTDKKSTSETRITILTDGKVKSLDLNVISTPITLSDQKFYALILQDISDEKRRISLERIFFHDLLNSIGGLNGLLNILKEGTDPAETRELINLSEEASREMHGEILLQKQIRAAERGDLQVNIDHFGTLEILESSIGKIRSHKVGKKKNTILDERCDNVIFDTDRVLLQRVIINLLKNALEATPDGGIVTAGVESQELTVRFWVKNESVIPPDVQLQLFQRSFSTKENGRGIGTYSIKMITENYLKGKVSFISNESEGTVFSVVLNKIFPADRHDSLIK